MFSQDKNGETYHTYGYTNAGWSDLLSSFDGGTITYDAIGNPLTYHDGKTFTWTAGRKLSTVTDGSDTYTYTYDGDGNRISKTVDGQATDYYYIDGKLLGLKKGQDSLLFLYDETDTAYGFLHNGTLYYYDINLQGDVVGIYNGSGNLVASYTYDVWGALLAIHSDYHAELALFNPLLYRGYYYDFETGFYYLQSHYYDPTVGRFINADGEIGANDDILSYNLFAYCSNNPVNYSDPTGQAREWVALGFSYDGSPRDFWRLEHGYPPYAYEQWLATGGKKQINRSKTEGGVTKTVKSATYVPAEKTKDQYIEMARPMTSLDTMEIINISIDMGTYVLKRKGYQLPPSAKYFIIAMNAIAGINRLSNYAELARYEEAMNQGTGVLIITWDVAGSRCVPASYNAYYSWNGKDDLFEEGDDLL